MATQRAAKTNRTKSAPQSTTMIDPAMVPIRTSSVLSRRRRMGIRLAMAGGDRTIAGKGVAAAAGFPDCRLTPAG